MAASEIIRNKAACVLMSSGERLFLVIASDQSLDVDCPKMLNAALSSVNGKGGGNETSPQEERRHLKERTMS